MDVICVLGMFQLHPAKPHVRPTHHPTQESHVLFMTSFVQSNFSFVTPPTRTVFHQNIVTLPLTISSSLSQNPKSAFSDPGRKTSTITLCNSSSHGPWNLQKRSAIYHKQNSNGFFPTICRNPARTLMVIRKCGAIYMKIAWCIMGNYPTDGWKCESVVDWQSDLILLFLVQSEMSGDGASMPSETALVFINVPKWERKIAGEHRILTPEYLHLLAVFGDWKWKSQT